MSGRGCKKLEVSLIDNNLPEDHMANNQSLFNAAVIGENPDASFIVEGNRLHAVEASIAKQKTEQSNPAKLLPLIQQALESLINYGQGKVEPHFLEMEEDSFENDADEEAHLIHQIHSIFSHLPHHDRNELSSLIHHKAGSKGK